MQQPNAACTRVPNTLINADLAFVLPAFGCCIPLLSCAQDGLDTVQLALVVFFLGALAHLRMSTQVNRQTLQLALQWWLYFYVVVVYILHITHSSIAIFYIVG